MINLEVELNEGFRRIKDRGWLHNSSTSHIHTNDINLGSAIETARYRINLIDGLLIKPTVGIIVGTGGLLSICPELPVDIWLVCDNNKFVLDWVDQAKYATRIATRLDDYLRIVYVENLQATQGYAESGLRGERESLGKYHLTTDEQRFQLVKQSARHISIVRCEGDLRDKKFSREFGEILKKQRLSISFANLTNVYEHAPGIYESLPNLPFRDCAVFIWSNRTFGKFLESEVIYGLDNYLMHAGAAYAQFINGFKNPPALKKFLQTHIYK